MNHPWTLLGLYSRMHQTWVTKTFLKVNFLAPCLEIQLGLQSCPPWDLAGSGPCQQSGSRRTHSPTSHVNSCTECPLASLPWFLQSPLQFLSLSISSGSSNLHSKLGNWQDLVPSREPGDRKSIQENCTICWTLTFSSFTWFINQVIIRHS